MPLFDTAMVLLGEPDEKMAAGSLMYVWRRDACRVVAVSCN